MLRLAAVRRRVYDRVRPAMARLARWALGRQISPNTLSGVCVLLALCSAIWMSAGPADRGGGLLALSGSVLAMFGAGQLAVFMSRVPRAEDSRAGDLRAGGSRRPWPQGKRRGGAESSTDWLALPEPSWQAATPGPGRPGDSDADLVILSRDDGADGAGQGADPIQVVSGQAASSHGPEASAGQVGDSQRPQASGGRLNYGWVRSVCGTAAESAIYGGMAAGGIVGRPGATWALAVVTVVSVGTSDLIGACRVAERGGQPCTRRLPALPPSARLVLAGLMLTIAGPRVALFSVICANALALAWVAATWGRTAPAPRAGRRKGMRSRFRRRSSTRPARTTVLTGMGGQSVPAARDNAGGGRTQVTAVVGVAGPAGTTSVRIVTSAKTTTARSRVSRTAEAGQSGDVEEPGKAAANREAGPGQVAGHVGAVSEIGSTSGVGAGDAAGPDAADLEAAAPQAADPEAADLEGEHHEPIPVGGLAGWVRETPARPAWPSGSRGWRRNRPRPEDEAEAQPPPSPQKADQGQSSDSGSSRILALRDDGAAALWAGRLVQGNLIPLPPALAGLIATAMLAALGLRDLRGFIAVTPPIVMMLAAPGSSHPHDGRFDWLVPSLLALAQFVYLGSLGFAVGVPGPAIYAACAMTALWYASLAAGGRTPSRTAGLGWEGRLFLTGLAVTFGLGTFGYLGLAAYLGVLLLRQAATAYLTPVEDDRQ